MIERLFGWETVLSGMLKTSFGGGQPPPKMAKLFKPVEGGAEGVVQALDALTIETTVGAAARRFSFFSSHFFSFTLPRIPRKK